MQRSLSDARENSARLSSTIESLMTSHTELQEAMERLNTDMGQKESELNILRRDKYVVYHLREEKAYELTLYLDLTSLQYENDALQSKIIAVEQTELQEVCCSILLEK